MPQNYAVRISRDSAETARYIGFLAQKADKVAAYEHMKDAKVSRTHVHVFLYGVQMSKRQLKDSHVQYFDQPFTKANSDWSWQTWDGDSKVLVYGSKGHIKPFYVKEYSSEFIEECRKAWKQPANYKPKSKNEKIFDEFVDFVGGMDTFQDEVTPYGVATAYEKMKKQALSYAVDSTGTMDGAAMRMYGMLWRTWCWRKGWEDPLQNDRKLKEA